MDAPRKIAAIVNPRAGGGRTLRRWPGIARKLERRVGRVATWFTEAPGSAIELARELARDAFDLVIAAGGDGTVNEVANGLIEDGRLIRPGIALGILPLGTGGDLRRTLQIPSRLSDALEVLASGVPAALDVGKVKWKKPEGQSAERYFVNMVSFGLGGEVAERAQRAPRALGGKAAFLWATLQALAGYRGKTIRLRLDSNSESTCHHVINIAVGNGQYQGGGMRPCPRALPNDGLLDVTVIDYLKAFELARDFRYLYSEDIYRHPKAHPFRARTVFATSDELVRVELDGEPLGSLPIEISLLPRLLPVLVPPSSPLLSPSP